MEEDEKQQNKPTWSWLVDGIQEFPQPFNIQSSPGMKKKNTFEQRLLKSNRNAVDIHSFFFSLLSGDLIKLFVAKVLTDEEHARDRAGLKRKGQEKIKTTTTRTKARGD